MKEAITRLDYCQYLLVSQINYTLTNFADPSEKSSHDEINRYLGPQTSITQNEFCVSPTKAALAAQPLPEAAQTLDRRCVQVCC